MTPSDQIHAQEEIIRRQSARICGLQRKVDRLTKGQDRLRRMLSEPRTENWADKLIREAEEFVGQ